MSDSSSAIVSLRVPGYQSTRFRTNGLNRIDRVVASESLHERRTFKPFGVLNSALEKADNPAYPQWLRNCLLCSAERYFFSSAFDFSAAFSFARSAFMASPFGESVLAVSLFLDSELLVDLPESEALLLAPFSAG